MADPGTAAGDRLPDRSDAIGALGDLRDMALDLADRGDCNEIHALFEQAMAGLALGAPYLPCQLCGHGLTDTTRDLLARGDIELLRVQKLLIDQFSTEVVLLRGQLAAAVELAEQLNVTCRYHGHHIERTVFGRPEPCCDTGREAVRNVRLIAALGVQQ